MSENLYILLCNTSAASSVYLWHMLLYFCLQFWAVRWWAGGPFQTQGEPWGPITQKSVWLKFFTRKVSVDFLRISGHFKGIITKLIIINNYMFMRYNDLRLFHKKCNLECSYCECNTWVFELNIILSMSVLFSIEAPFKPEIKTTRQLKNEINKNKTFSQVQLTFTTHNMRRSHNSVILCSKSRLLKTNCFKDRNLSFLPDVWGPQIGNVVGQSPP